MPKKHPFRRWLAVWLAMVMLLLLPTPAFAESLLYDYPQTENDTIVSPSALMLYMGLQPEQDILLYEKEADTRYQPGALMRVAVAGYAMKLIREQGMDLDATTAAYSLELFNHHVAGTGLHVALMDFGETWKLRDLLTLSVMQTAADCAVTLANKLSGSPDAFVEGLNAFAQELGCTNSHFTNVMGLNEEENYMSARDVMRFTRYAMQYPEIRAMLELEQWTVQPISGGSRRSWPASNEMLRESSPVYYAYTVGGRTGGTTTEMSLVEYGSLDGYEYMAVVMGAPRKNAEGNLTNAAYGDARRLIRWGLIGFTYETLVRKEEPVGRLPVKGSSQCSTLSLVPEQDVTTVVSQDTDLSKISRKITLTQESCRAPVEKGEPLGTLDLYLGDKHIASVTLVAGESAPYNIVYAAWQGFRSVLFSGWTLLLLVLFLLLIVVYVFFNIRYNRQRKRTWKSHNQHHP